MGKVHHYNDDDQASWTRRHTDTFYEKNFVCDGYCSAYQLPENRRKLRNLAARMHGNHDVKLPTITECVEAPDSAYPDGQRVSGAAGPAAPETCPHKSCVGFGRTHGGIGACCEGCYKSVTRFRVEL